jgi:pseudaminic acid synthase
MQSIEWAKKTMRAAKEAGADAIKLQTYSPDTITIDSDRLDFGLKDSQWELTLQDRKSIDRMYDLYKKSYTPWEWHKELFDYAKEIGITIFSTAYDFKSANFLNELGVPAFKISSFELIDIPLIQHIAKFGKPTILSTGMGTIGEVSSAVSEIIAEECPLALLKCVSAYPAPIEETNIRAIQTLENTFNVPVGLSDHSLSTIAPVMAVAVGACIIEKHIMLEGTTGPDTGFSQTPFTFGAMVNAVREAESALGNGKLGCQPHETPNLQYRKSLYAVKDIKKGEELTPENIRSIRPSYGLHPNKYYLVLGRIAKRDIERGEPLKMEDTGR